MPRKVYVTDPALFQKHKVKEETKEEKAARIAKRQLAVGQDVKTRLGDHYVVDRKIGAGGMGEVYLVHPVNDPDLKYAMKTEGDGPDKSLLRLKCETFVYKRIAKTNPKEIDKSHYVKMIDAGMTNEAKFIIMDLIWQPLHIVIGDILNWKLSAHTKVSIARQTLQGIEGLHTIGFLHRDVKPSNFAVGLPPHDKVIYTLDFGVARYFFDKKGKVKVAREKVIYMGTLRYAPIAGLEEKEQGRREDLEGWLYMMMEIYDRKNLKWRDLGWDEQKLCTSMKKDVFRIWKTGGLNLKLPHAYYDIINVIDRMGYYLKDDGLLTWEIEKIYDILDKFVKEERIDMTLPLDWVTVGVGGAAKRKERDEKGDEARGGKRKDEKDRKRSDRESKKKRREERGEEVKDSGSRGRNKKQNRSNSKSESKEKRRRQTQTDADNSANSESDTPNSMCGFKTFKQWKEYRKDQHKKSRDKRNRQGDGMKTAMDKDEKERKAEDKTIDEKSEVDEKKERTKDMEKEDTGKKTRFGLPKNATAVKIDETEADEKRKDRTREKMNKTVGEMTEADEKRNERKKENRDKIDEKKEERKKEDKGDDDNKSRLGKHDAKIEDN